MFKVSLFSRNLLSIRVFFLLIFSLSIGFVFAFEIPAVKSEVTHINSEKGEFIKVGDYKPVPVYGAEKRNNFNLNAENQARILDSLVKKQAEFHTVSGTFYSIKDNLKAVLMLNNKGDAPLYVTPTFYSLAGKTIELKPLEVNGVSSKEFDLKKLLAKVGAEFHEGSLAVTCQGGGDATRFAS